MNFFQNFSYLATYVYTNWINTYIIHTHMHTARDRGEDLGKICKTDLPRKVSTTTLGHWLPPEMIQHQQAFPGGLLLITFYDIPKGVARLFYNLKITGNIETDRIPE